MALWEELERVAAVASGFAEADEALAGVLAAEPGPGRRVYLCAFERGAERSWLALDAAGAPLEDRLQVREAATITALCELAADTAGGGDLDELRRRLVAVRLRENPPGIDEAEEAALGLERVVGAPPRVATPAYLDDVGAATRRLELALGEDASPFAAAMKQAVATVESLADEVEATYKRSLV